MNHWRAWLFGLLAVAAGLWGCDPRGVDDLATEAAAGSWQTFGSGNTASLRCTAPVSWQVKATDGGTQWHDLVYEDGSDQLSATLSVPFGEWGNSDLHLVIDNDKGMRSDVVVSLTDLPQNTSLAVTFSDLADQLDQLGVKFGFAGINGAASWQPTEQTYQLTIDQEITIGDVAVGFAAETANDTLKGATFKLDLPDGFGGLDDVTAAYQFPDTIDLSLRDQLAAFTFPVESGKLTVDATLNWQANIATQRTIATGRLDLRYTLGPINCRAYLSAQAGGGPTTVDGGANVTVDLRY